MTRGPRSSIEQHPQFKAIVDSLLSMTPQREIAKRFNVSQAALSRFSANTLKKALSRKNPMDAVGVRAETAQTIKQSKSESAELIRLESTAALLEKKWSGIERMKALAESKSDVGGWASLDRAETAALQLRAQLAGELQPQVTGNVQVAILIPSPAAMRDAGQVIDIDAQQGALARDDSGRSDGDNSDD